MTNKCMTAIQSQVEGLVALADKSFFSGSENVEIFYRSKHVLH